MWLDIVFFMWPDIDFLLCLQPNLLAYFSVNQCIVLEEDIGKTRISETLSKMWSHHETIRRSLRLLRAGRLCKFLEQLLSIVLKNTLERGISY